MKKIIQRILCIIGILISTLAALYIGLSVYYEGGFTYGTWVNAVYCTGKTVSQINTELVAADSYEKIELVLPDGSCETVFMDEIAYQTDFTGALLEIKNRQDPWRWYHNLSAASRDRSVIPTSSLDEALLDAVLSKMEFVRSRKTDEAYEVYIKKTSEGYVLINEREQVLDREACLKAVTEAIRNREERIDLLEAGCYQPLPLDPKMKETMKLWEEIAEFQDCGIVYCFGEQQEAVDASVVCDWLMPLDETVNLQHITARDAFQRDENGEFLVDQEKLEAYVDALADRYDTVGAVRQFQTTRGDVVTIAGGTYGNQIDRKAEKEYLYPAFLERKRELHEPAYLKEAWKKGTDDIGDTYIEVDMGNQHLYYYREGELVLDAPIVTGNMMRKRDTPAAVCYVYAKQKNRVLRGPGYASPVKYWMPVKGGIGIHDARWRKEFGGEIYKTEGSHGCINMPLEKAEQLYGEVEIGTPVVMFY